MVNTIVTRIDTVRAGVAALMNGAASFNAIVTHTDTTNPGNDPHDKRKGQLTLKSQYKHTSVISQLIH